ncbi:MAG: hypothetical protein A2W80_03430 [Candidatus Riflebacteria bacterium GWC2_50_8]|nr:MAG: hypothetical protein A2W80_03430 [Candidatus Riflebacteria bacterium GWC2_50_8]
MSITRLATNDSGFIFDPATGTSFTANKTAVFIIRNLQKGLNTREISQELVEKFEGAEDEMSRDIDDFIEHLKVLGFKAAA